MMPVAHEVMCADLNYLDGWQCDVLTIGYSHADPAIAQVGLQRMKGRVEIPGALLRPDDASERHGLHAAVAAAVDVERPLKSLRLTAAWTVPASAP